MGENYLRPEFAKAVDASKNGQPHRGLIEIQCGEQNPAEELNFCAAAPDERVASAAKVVVTSYRRYGVVARRRDLFEVVGMLLKKADQYSGRYRAEARRGSARSMTIRFCSCQARAHQSAARAQPRTPKTWVEGKAGEG